MGFTRSERDLKIIQKLSDYPNAEDGMSAEQLKESFDEGSLILQEDINNLIGELQSSGATHIGANPIDETDDSEGTIEAKLRYLKEEIKGVALGTIPDGSISENKLEPNYANSLAKKDGTVQNGLVSENSTKFNGYSLNELWTVGEFINNFGDSQKEIIVGFRPRIVTLISPDAETEYVNMAIFINGKGVSVGDTRAGKEEIELTETGFIIQRDTDFLSHNHKTLYAAFR